MPTSISDLVSLPRGDISKLVSSSPFELTCHMNPKHEFYAKRGFRAKDLGFFAIEEVAGNQFSVRKNFSDIFEMVMVDEQRLFKESQLESTIVNDTTILSSYDPQVVGSTHVDCRIKVPKSDEFKGICKQVIHVGCEPPFFNMK